MSEDCGLRPVRQASYRVISKRRSSAQPAQSVDNGQSTPRGSRTPDVAASKSRTKGGSKKEKPAVAHISRSRSVQDKRSSGGGHSSSKGLENKAKPTLGQQVASGGNFSAIRHTESLDAWVETQKKLLSEAAQKYGFQVVPNSAAGGDKYIPSLILKLESVASADTHAGIATRDQSGTDIYNPHSNVHTQHKQRAASEPARGRKTYKLKEASPSVTPTGKSSRASSEKRKSEATTPPRSHSGQLVTNRPPSPSDVVPASAVGELSSMEMNYPPVCHDSYSMRTRKGKSKKSKNGHAESQQTDNPQAASPKKGSRSKERDKAEDPEVSGCLSVQKPCFRFGDIKLDSAKSKESTKSRKKSSGDVPSTKGKKKSEHRAKRKKKAPELTEPCPSRCRIDIQEEETKPAQVIPEPEPQTRPQPEPQPEPQPQPVSDQPECEPRPPRRKPKCEAKGMHPCFRRERHGARKTATTGAHLLRSFAEAVGSQLSNIAIRNRSYPGFPGMQGLYTPYGDLSSMFYPNEPDEICEEDEEEQSEEPKSSPREPREWPSTPDLQPEVVTPSGSKRPSTQPSVKSSRPSDMGAPTEADSQPKSTKTSRASIESGSQEKSVTTMKTRASMESDMHRSMRKSYTDTPIEFDVPRKSLRASATPSLVQSDVKSSVSSPKEESDKISQTRSVREHEYLMVAEREASLSDTSSARRKSLKVPSSKLLTISLSQTASPRRGTLSESEREAVAGSRQSVAGGYVSEPEEGPLLEEASQTLTVIERRPSFVQTRSVESPVGSHTPERDTYGPDIIEHITVFEDYPVQSKHSSKETILLEGKKSITISERSLRFDETQPGTIPEQIKMLEVKQSEVMSDIRKEKDEFKLSMSMSEGLQKTPESIHSSPKSVRTPETPESVHSRAKSDSILSVTRSDGIQAVPESIHSRAMSMNTQEMFENIHSTAISVQTQGTPECIHSTAMSVKMQEPSESIHSTAMTVKMQEPSESIHSTAMTVKAQEPSESIHTTAMSVTTQGMSERLHSTTMSVKAPGKTESIHTTAMSVITQGTPESIHTTAMSMKTHGTPESIHLLASSEIMQEAGESIRSLAMSVKTAQESIHSVADSHKTQEIPESMKSLPISQKTHETTASLHSIPISQKIQESLHSLPISQEAQEPHESLHSVPISHKTHETTASLHSIPISQKTHESLHSTPISQRTQATPTSLHSITISQKTQEPIESLHSITISQKTQEPIESLHSIPVSQKTQEPIESLHSIPVSQKTQEPIESLHSIPVSQKTQEPIESLHSIPVSQKTPLESLYSLPPSQRTEEPPESIRSLPISQRTEKPPESIRSLPFSQRTEEPLESLHSIPVSQRTEEPIESLHSIPVSQRTEEPIESLHSIPVSQRTEEPLESLRSIPVSQRTEEPLESLRSIPVSQRTQEPLESLRSIPVSQRTQEPLESLRSIPVSQRTQEPLESLRSIPVSQRTEEPLESLRSIPVSQRTQEPLESLRSIPVSQRTQEPLESLLSIPVSQRTQEPLESLRSIPVSQRTQEPLESLRSIPVSQRTQEPLESLRSIPVSQRTQEPLESLLSIPVSQRTQEPLESLRSIPVSQRTQEPLESLLSIRVSQRTQEPLESLLSIPVSQRTQEPLESLRSIPVSQRTQEPLESLRSIPVSQRTQEPLESLRSIPVSQRTQEPLESSRSIPVSQRTQEPLESLRSIPVSQRTQEPLESLRSIPVSQRTQESLESLRSIPVSQRTQEPLESLRSIPVSQRTQEPLESLRSIPVSQRTQEPPESLRSIPVSQRTQEPLESLRSIPVSQRTQEPLESLRSIPVSQRTQEPLESLRSIPVSQRTQEPLESLRSIPVSQRTQEPLESLRSIPVSQRTQEPLESLRSIPVSQRTQEPLESLRSIPISRKTQESLHSTTISHKTQESLEGKYSEFTAEVTSKSSEKRQPTVESESKHETPESTRSIVTINMERQITESRLSLPKSDRTHDTIKTRIQSTDLQDSKTLYRDTEVEIQSDRRCVPESKYTLASGETVITDGVKQLQPETERLMTGEARDLPVKCEEHTVLKDERPISGTGMADIPKTAYDRSYEGSSQIMKSSAIHFVPDSSRKPSVFEERQSTTSYRKVHAPSADIPAASPTAPADTGQEYMPLVRRESADVAVDRRVTPDRIGDGRGRKDKYWSPGVQDTDDRCLGAGNIHSILITMPRHPCSNHKRSSRNCIQVCSSVVKSAHRGIVTDAENEDMGISRHELPRATRRRYKQSEMIDSSHQTRTRDRPDKLSLTDKCAALFNKNFGPKSPCEAFIRDYQSDICGTPLQERPPWRELPSEVPPREYRKVHGDAGKSDKSGGSYYPEGRSTTGQNSPSRDDLTSPDVEVKDDWRKGDQIYGDFDQEELQDTISVDKRDTPYSKSEWTDVSQQVGDTTDVEISPDEHNQRISTRGQDYEKLEATVQPTYQSSRIKSRGGQIVSREKCCKAGDYRICVTSSNVSTSPQSDGSSLMVKVTACPDGKYRTPSRKRRTPHEQVTAYERPIKQSVTMSPRKSQAEDSTPFTDQDRRSRRLNYSSQTRDRQSKSGKQEYASSRNPTASPRSSLEYEHARRRSRRSNNGGDKRQRSSLYPRTYYDDVCQDEAEDDGDYTRGDQRDNILHANQRERYSTQRPYSKMIPSNAQNCTVKFPLRQESTSADKASSKVAREKLNERRSGQNIELIQNKSRQERLSPRIHSPRHRDNRHREITRGQSSSWNNLESAQNYLNSPSRISPKAKTRHQGLEVTAVSSRSTHSMDSRDNQVRVEVWQGCYPPHCNLSVNPKNIGDFQRKFSYPPETSSSQSSMSEVSTSDDSQCEDDSENTLSTSSGDLDCESSTVKSQKGLRARTGAKYESQKKCPKSDIKKLRGRITIRCSDGHGSSPQSLRCKNATVAIQKGNVRMIASPRGARIIRCRMSDENESSSKSQSYFTPPETGSGCSLLQNKCLENFLSDSCMDRYEPKSQELKKRYWRLSEFCDDVTSQGHRFNNTSHDDTTNAGVRSNRRLPSPRIRSFLLKSRLRHNSKTPGSELSLLDGCMSRSNSARQSSSTDTPEIIDLFEQIFTPAQASQRSGRQEMIHSVKTATKTFAYSPLSVNARSETHKHLSPVSRSSILSSQECVMSSLDEITLVNTRNVLTEARVMLKSTLQNEISSSASRRKPHNSAMGENISDVYPSLTSRARASAARASAARASAQGQKAADRTNNYDLLNLYCVDLDLWQRNHNFSSSAGGNTNSSSANGGSPDWTNDVDVLNYTTPPERHSALSEPDLNTTQPGGSCERRQTSIVCNALANLSHATESVQPGMCNRHSHRYIQMNHGASFRFHGARKNSPVELPSSPRQDKQADTLEICSGETRGSTCYTPTVLKGIYSNNVCGGLCSLEKISDSSNRAKINNGRQAVSILNCPTSSVLVSKFDSQHQLISKHRDEVSVSVHNCREAGPEGKHLYVYGNRDHTAGDRAGRPQPPQIEPDQVSDSIPTGQMLSKMSAENRPMQEYYKETWEILKGGIAVETTGTLCEGKRSGHVTTRLVGLPAEEEDRLRSSISEALSISQDFTLIPLCCSQAKSSSSAHDKISNFLEPWNHLQTPELAEPRDQAQDLNTTKNNSDAESALVVNDKMRIFVLSSQGKSEDMGGDMGEDMDEDLSEDMDEDLGEDMDECVEISNNSVHIQDSHGGAYFVNEKNGRHQQSHSSREELQKLSDTSLKQTGSDMGKTYYVFTTNELLKLFKKSKKFHDDQLEKLQFNESKKLHDTKSKNIHRKWTEKRCLRKQTPFFKSAGYPGCMTTLHKFQETQECMFKYPSDKDCTENCSREDKPGTEGSAASNLAEQEGVGTSRDMDKVRHDTEDIHPHMCSQSRDSDVINVGSNNKTDYITACSSSEGASAAKSKTCTQVKSNNVAEVDSEKECENKNLRHQQNAIEFLGALIEDKLKVFFDKALNRWTSPSQKKCSQLTRINKCEESRVKTEPQCHQVPATKSCSSCSSTLSHGDSVSTTSVPESVTERSVTEESLVLFSLPASLASTSKKQTYMERSRSSKRQLYDLAKRLTNHTLKYKSKRSCLRQKYVLSIKRKVIVSAKKRHRKNTRGIERTNSSTLSSENTPQTHQSECDSTQSDCDSNHLGCDSTQSGYESAQSVYETAQSGYESAQSDYEFGKLKTGGEYQHSKSCRRRSKKEHFPDRHQSSAVRKSAATSRSRDRSSWRRPAVCLDKSNTPTVRSKVIVCDCRKHGSLATGRQDRSKPRRLDDQKLHRHSKPKDNCKTRGIVIEIKCNRQTGEPNELKPGITVATSADTPLMSSDLIECGQVQPSVRDLTVSAICVGQEDRKHKENVTMYTDLSRETRYDHHKSSTGSKNNYSTAKRMKRENSKVSSPRSTELCRSSPRSTELCRSSPRSTDHSDTSLMAVAVKNNTTVKRAGGCRGADWVECECMKSYLLPPIQEESLSQEQTSSDKSRSEFEEIIDKSKLKLQELSEEIARNITDTCTSPSVSEASGSYNSSRANHASDSCALLKTSHASNSYKVIASHVSDSCNTSRAQADDRCMTPRAGHVSDCCSTLRADQVSYSYTTLGANRVSDSCVLLKANQLNYNYATHRSSPHVSDSCTTPPARNVSDSCTTLRANQNCGSCTTPRRISERSHSIALYRPTIRERMLASEIQKDHELSKNRTDGHFSRREYNCVNYQDSESLAHDRNRTEPKIYDDFFSYIQSRSPFKSAFLRREMTQTKRGVSPFQEASASKKEEELLRLYAGCRSSSCHFRAPAVDLSWHRKNINMSGMAASNDRELCKIETSPRFRSASVLNSRDTLTPAVSEIQTKTVSAGYLGSGCTFTESKCRSSEYTHLSRQLDTCWAYEPTNSKVDRLWSHDDKSYESSYRCLIKKNWNESANNGDNNTFVDVLGDQDTLEMREWDHCGGCPSIKQLRMRKQTASDETVTSKDGCHFALSVRSGSTLLISPQTNLQVFNQATIQLFTQANLNISAQTILQEDMNCVTVVRLCFGHGNNLCIQRHMGVNLGVNGLNNTNGALVIYIITDISLSCELVNGFLTERHPCRALVNGIHTVRRYLPELWNVCFQKESDRNRPARADDSKIGCDDSRNKDGTKEEDYGSKNDVMIVIEKCRLADARTDLMTRNFKSKDTQSNQMPRQTIDTNWQKPPTKQEQFKFRRKRTTF